MTYTVVAAYFDPPSIYCEIVEAANPDEALALAWEKCKDANWGSDRDFPLERDEEWADMMVIEGAVKVLA